MIHYYIYLFVKKNVFNYSELHFSEVTSYKIHTLVTANFHFENNTRTATGMDGTLHTDFRKSETSRGIKKSF